MSAASGAWLARAASEASSEAAAGRVSIDGAVGSVDAKRYIRQAIALHYCSRGEGEGAAWRRWSTQRSRHTPPCRTSCRTGSASMNSLARTMSGPSGTSSIALAPLDRRERAASVACCSLAQYGARLDQSDGDAARNLGTLRQARSASAISVPRPGPSSATIAVAGLAHRLPDGDGPQAEKLAEDLADLRRGDEIAFSSDRLARGVIAGARVGEAGLHIVVDADRPFAGDPLLKPRRKRRSSVRASFGCVASRGESRLPPRAPDQPRADQDHGDGIDDARREDADIQRVSGMGLAHELDQAAEDAIEDRGTARTPCPGRVSAR